MGPTILHRYVDCGGHYPESSRLSYYSNIAEMENLEVNREAVSKCLYCRNMENSDSKYREAVTKCLYCRNMKSSDSKYRKSVSKCLYCRNMENSDSIYREAVTKLKILLSATQISGILRIDI